MRLITILLAMCMLSKAYGQYWQQEVNYEIEVELNDRNNSLTGFEKIVYVNNSPDTLRYIWFHLWPNAYKDERTAYGEQVTKNGNTQFYFSSKEEKGYINRLDFRVNGVTAKTEDHPQHIDITKVLLPTPLAPGQRITITTPFHVKLPFNFSRSGYNKKNFQIAQWYPKPAVYDGKGGDEGWHPMPYLDQGEFYSEFGKFQVRITLPAYYMVGATGELLTASEKEWLLTKSYRNDSITRATGKIPRIDSARTKTLEFVQDNVHDFAWFANPEFLVDQDTCMLPSGKIIQLTGMYTPDFRPIWKHGLRFMKDAARFYSREVGEYPYNTITAVQGVPGTGAGMEYPTITLISPVVRSRDLDVILAHEIGHNWFYGILASNERSHPWMDEGFNTFYEYKYISDRYPAGPEYSEILLQTMIKQHRDQVITSSSEELSKFGYAATAYHKTSKWLQLVESKLGAEQFRSLMQVYYNNWKFKHPQPSDFLTLLESAMGKGSAEVISLLNAKGDIPVTEKEKLRIITPLQPQSFKSFLESPAKNTFLFTPAVGYNKYDKLMLGAVVSNYKLPPSSFQFVLAPLYSTGAKQLNGIGRLNYTHYSPSGNTQLDLFITGARFSNNSFATGKEGDLKTSFTKVAPGLMLTFKSKDPQSTVRRFAEFKSFFIGEQPLVYREDSIFQGSDTIINAVYSKTTLSTQILQFRLGIENNRTLYPYAADITLQQNKYFTRLAFEGNYYFNYPTGGMQVRLFAGKLFSNRSSYPYGFDINRYALNMSGVSGNEDYLYKNYFIGRNEYEGLASQQIMIRDGGFKVSTELFSNEVGKTGNWLGAVNFTSTIPAKLNPLAILPVQIPLRLFADIGTYAEAWDQDHEGDRFLYDAGVQLSLNNEMINIYFPLFYSSQFSEYVKSVHTKKRFFRTVTFSINLSAPIKHANRQVTL